MTDGVPHRFYYNSGPSGGYEDGMTGLTKDENLLDFDGDEPLSGISQQPTPSTSPSKQQKSNIDDLLDILGDMGGSSSGGAPAAGGFGGIAAFGASGFGSPSAPSKTLMLNSGEDFFGVAHFRSLQQLLF